MTKAPEYHKSRSTQDYPPRATWTADLIGPITPQSRYHSQHLLHLEEKSTNYTYLAGLKTGKSTEVIEAIKASAKIVARHGYDKARPTNTPLATGFTAADTEAPTGAAISGGAKLWTHASPLASL